MKMYANYILERLGRDLIVYADMGFATFKITDDECHLVDIHVEKEYRRQKVASNLADDVVKIAKKRGCKTLVGYVDLRANNPESSEKALLAYGLKFALAVDEGNLKVYTKEI